MTIRDWVQESRQRFREDPVPTAARESAVDFARGVNRRTIEPRLGSVCWERDWDVLLVLDACRVDLAREYFDKPVESHWSAASTSIDWIQRHFADEYRDEWESTAYVTANPFADHDTESARSANLREKDLGYLDLVFERGFQEVEGVKTTPPEVVTDAAIHAWRTQDVDRMVVHYMQPHQPFRGRADWESVYSNLENLATDVNHGGPDIWKRCRDGDIGRGELWRAYRDNLDWVWTDVQTRLLRNVGAETVAITADHGNGMGEWGVWSHPPGALVPAVRKVPWLEVEATDEKSVIPDVDGRTTSDSVAEQLDALGYR